MTDAPGTLYRRLLGSAWEELSPSVRHAHTTASTVRGSGRLRIAHGRSLGARWLARLLRLPRATDAADTRLVISPDAGGERWSRTFDDSRFDTRQYEGGERALVERFGALELRFQLEAAQGSLCFRSRDAALVWGPVRVPLSPKWAPRVDAREDAAGMRRIRIHVRVAVPGLGPVLTYEGCIDIEESHA